MSKVIIRAQSGWQVGVPRHTRQVQETGDLILGAPQVQGWMKSRNIK